MQPTNWLPLTEYALRSGMSISTLRRKIKSKSVEYRMEDGRYLIRFDDMAEESSSGFTSSDDPPHAPDLKDPILDSNLESELLSIRMEMHKNKEEAALRWRALEARVTGLAKRLESFSEQMAEVNMLVKIFEEKLDSRV